MVDRAPPVVGRSDVHVALGASSAEPPAGSSRGCFVMAGSQPVRLAYRVLLLLAVCLCSETAWAQQSPET
jgi:hypothetical protein